MWNRVVLLACGMAFGWGLANYWAASGSEVGKHRYRLALSATLGLLLCGALAWEHLPSGLIALSMLGGTAFIAYAARAKQLGKPQATPLARPETLTRRREGTALVLVADAEPRSYDGPEVWAQRMRQPRFGSRAAPHWLLRPYLCHRIRAAYERMPAGPPSLQALDWLVAQVQERVGARVSVVGALRWGEPSVASALRQLAAQGHSHALLLPIDLEDEAAVDLRQSVVRSRVREAGLVVDIVPGCAAGIWDARAVADRLDALAQGTPPAENPLPGLHVSECVVQRVAERV